MVSKKLEQRLAGIAEDLDEYGQANLYSLVHTTPAVFSSQIRNSVSKPESVGLPYISGMMSGVGQSMIIHMEVMEKIYEVGNALMNYL